MPHLWAISVRLVRASHSIIFKILAPISSIVFLLDELSNGLSVEPEFDISLGCSAFKHICNLFLTERFLEL